MSLEDTLAIIRELCANRNGVVILTTRDGSSMRFLPTPSATVGTGTQEDPRSVVLSVGSVANSAIPPISVEQGRTVSNEANRQEGLIQEEEDVQNVETVREENKEEEHDQLKENERIEIEGRDSDEREGETHESFANDRNRLSPAELPVQTAERTEPQAINDDTEAPNNIRVEGEEQADADREHGMDREESAENQALTGQGAAKLAIVDNIRVEENEQANADQDNVMDHEESADDQALAGEDTPRLKKINASLKIATRELVKARAKLAKEWAQHEQKVERRRIGRITALATTAKNNNERDSDDIGRTRSLGEGPNGTANEAAQIRDKQEKRTTEGEVEQCKEKGDAEELRNQGLRLLEEWAAGKALAKLTEQGPLMISLRKLYVFLKPKDPNYHLYQNKILVKYLMPLVRDCEMSQKLLELMESAVDELKSNDSSGQEKSVSADTPIRVTATSRRSFRRAAIGSEEAPDAVKSLEKRRKM